MMKTGTRLSCLRTKPSYFLRCRNFEPAVCDSGSGLPGPAGLPSKTSLVRAGRLPPSIRALRDQLDLVETCSRCIPSWPGPTRRTATITKKLQDYPGIPGRRSEIATRGCESIASRIERGRASRSPRPQRATSNKSGSSSAHDVGVRGAVERITGLGMSARRVTRVFRSFGLGLLGFRMSWIDPLLPVRTARSLWPHLRWNRHSRVPAVVRSGAGRNLIEIAERQSQATDERSCARPTLLWS
jgi:hypothetical protein